MKIDPASEDSSSLYRLVTSLVAPRPIAWISTVDDSGKTNLAPYSSFNYVNFTPPILMFSAGDKNQTELKDTPSNILSTEEFVVNVVTRSLGKKMDRTSASVDESEFTYADVDSSPSEIVDPPIVAESAAAMECTFHSSKRFGDHTVIFGEVVQFHIDNELFIDNKIDSLQIETIGRIGGPYYSDTDPVELQRNFDFGV